MAPTRDRARAARGALVLGGDYKALGVVRSLGRHGIPVWVLTDDHLLAGWSRYCRRAVAWPSAPEAEQVARLLELGRECELEGWTLYPAGEEEAAFLARNRDTLAERYRSSVLVPWEILQQAYDKRLAHRLADSVDVDHPRTWQPRDRDDVAAYDGPFPAILKPAMRPSLDPFTIDKAWPVHDRAELLSRYDEARAVSDVSAIMIQELVAGGGDAQLSFAALCRDGEPIAHLAARRTRQWPMDFGRASTFVETIDAPDVEAAARRILRALRFDGIVEVEFKRDARDGRLLLLDINPRVWGWHTLGRAAGVDFPYLLWRMVHGEEIAPVRGRVGVRWVRALTDVPTALGAIRRGQLSLFDYLWSLRPSIECAVFAFDDVLPALLELPATAYVAWGRRQLGAARAAGAAR